MADPFGVRTREEFVDPTLATRATRDPLTLTRTPRIEPFEEVVADPVVEEAQVGSPLNTLYGVDSESFLTDDQRKLARMIQGKFDASANRRDRELARYGAPMLSSFTEDEALARAMAGAQALNYRPPEEATVDPYGLKRTGNTPFGGVKSTRTPTPTTKDTEPTDAQNNAQWQRILSGLTSLIPLLFGKDAFGNFLNKGALQWGKELLFGKDAPAISDQAFEQLVRTGGTNGPIQYNPITGMPMGPSGGYGGGSQFGDPYGPGSGYGNDVITPPVQDYWNDPGMWDSGYWYPDLGGSLFDGGDPFGIGGW